MRTLQPGEIVLNRRNDCVPALKLKRVVDPSSIAPERTRKSPLIATQSYRCCTNGTAVRGEINEERNRHRRGPRKINWRPLAAPSEFVSDIVPEGHMVGHGCQPSG